MEWAWCGQVWWKNEVMWMSLLLKQFLCLMLFATLRAVWGDMLRVCSSWATFRREFRLEPWPLSAPHLAFFPVAIGPLCLARFWKAHNSAEKNLLFSHIYICQRQIAMMCDRNDV